MRISIAELDYWIAKGFSGILYILQERLRRVPCGFNKRVRSLMQIQANSMRELNDGVQCRDQEEYPKDETTMGALDDWFARGFTAMDKYIEVRSTESATPINKSSLQEMQDHIDRLQLIINREKEKCRPSRGPTVT